jgi:hypothetical protein
MSCSSRCWCGANGASISNVPSDFLTTILSLPLAAPSSSPKPEDCEDEDAFSRRELAAAERLKERNSVLLTSDDFEDLDVEREAIVAGGEELLCLGQD